MKYYPILLAILLFQACAGGGAEATEETQKKAEQATPKEPNIVGKEITYTADSVEMKGFLCYDAKLEGKRPGVIVVHEWWGHNEHSRNSARKLAEDGYVAFALDMYGNGKQADHPDDAGAFAGAVMSDFDGAQSRFNAAMDVLKSSEYCDQDELAAIGYCFGGGVVLNIARQGADLDAVATFHGSIGAIEPAQPGDVKAKILVLNGADDPFVPEEAIQSFKAEMDSANVDYEFVNYPGAVHAFTNPQATEKGKEFDLPLAYNEEVTKKSWKKMEDFLTEVFEK